MIVALQELAKKRSELGAAIIALARVEGVDPAPYLGVEAGGVEISGAPLKIVLPKADTPPRPSKPAPSKTTRAGQDKGAKKDWPGVIVAALQQADEPMSPGELARAIGANLSALNYNLKPLIGRGTVKATGQTSGRRISLA